MDKTRSKDLIFVRPQSNIVSIIQAIIFVAWMVKLVLLTYLGERGLFCPPDLKIFLHFDFGFLQ